MDLWWNRVHRFDSAWTVRETAASAAEGPGESIEAKEGGIKAVITSPLQHGELAFALRSDIWEVISLVEHVRFKAKILLFPVPVYRGSCHPVGLLRRHLRHG